MTDTESSAEVGANDSTEQGAPGLRTEIPPPDQQLSALERYCAQALMGFALLLLSAALMLTYAPENILAVTFDEYILQPILGEQSGDSKFNVVDTAVYALLLLLFVIVLSAWLRRSGMPAGDRGIYALIPWVAWASTVEVIEDARLYDSDISFLFVSPVIHFHVAMWVILAGVLAVLAMRHCANPRLAITRIALALVILQMIFLAPLWPDGFSPWLLLQPIVIFPLIGLLLVLLLHLLLSAWHPVEAALAQTGIGFVASSLGVWAQYMLSPWGIKAATVEPVLWPAAIIIGIPMVVFLLLHLKGRKAVRTLRGMGLSAGMLPLGFTIDDWERQGTQSHDCLERLSPAAVLATPALVLASFGQLVDGLATWWGMAHYENGGANYGEKNVLSLKVMILVGGDPVTGEGGEWGFLILKCVLAGVVLLYFATARFEHRHRHRRALIVVALLAVGLAPGLRDLGRMLLGGV